MTNEEEEKEVLNNDNTEINKGFELLLRNRRKEKPKSKKKKIAKLEFFM